MEDETSTFTFKDPNAEPTPVSRLAYDIAREELNKDSIDMDFVVQLLDSALKATELEQRGIR